MLDVAAIALGVASSLRAPHAWFTCLAVSAADFATELARLQHAGVNFSHARYEQAPRRPPTAMPHYMLG